MSETRYICPTDLFGNGRPASRGCPRALPGALLLLLLAFLVSRSASGQNPVESGPVPPAAASPAERTGDAPLGVIESAVYQAKVSGSDLVDGEFTCDVVRRGSGPAILDWSNVRAALYDLQWTDQPVLSGLTSLQKTILLTDRDADRLSGHWSAHGQVLGEKTIFDLELPPALNTRIQLDVPADQAIEVSQGLLTQGPLDRETSLRRWILELGRTPATTLRITPQRALAKAVPARYEIDTVHHARRDGIFLRSDLTLDWPQLPGRPLELQVAEGLDIQSVTIGGAPVAWSRDASIPGRLNLSTERMTLDPRFTVRIRAFQPVVWGARKTLTSFQIPGAIQTRRTVTIRVEPPLQLRSVDAPGMVQTDLTADETTGEVWKYEARELEAEVAVDIGFPQSAIVADVNCVADARPNQTWALAIMSLRVENGTRFETVVQLPEEWKLISVAAEDSESRIASWELDRQLLTVSWQSPMTRTSARQLRLFVRTRPWKEGVTTRLPVPVIQHASEVATQYQLLLPSQLELQILDGEGWRLMETSELSPQLLKSHEVAERVSDLSTLTVSGLRSLGAPRSDRVLISLATRVSSPEAPMIQGQVSASAPPEAAAPQDSESTPPELPPPSATLQLLTMAGQSANQERVHHALIQFDRPLRASLLDVRLPASCRLSAVAADDQPVTVLREEDQVLFPAEINALSRLQLTYVTSATPGLLYVTSDIPVPQTTVQVVNFDWTVDLPREQRLKDFELPGLLSGAEQRAGASWHVFGPLSRATSERVFNPASTSDWKGALGQTLQVNSNDGAVRQSLRFIAPAVGSSVRITTWDMTRTRNYAWVSLLGCLLVGAAGRLFQLTWLRRMSLVWLAILLLLAAVAPAAWAMILGGMLSGSLLSVLIPRSWMQKRDFLCGSEAVTATRRELMTTAGLLLVLNLPVPDAPQLQAAAPASASVSALSAGGIWPQYLIQSARYELKPGHPVPAVHASFQVLARWSSEPVLVRFPFQEVVFSPEAECLVDGIRQTLIPSLNGDAMLLRLEKAEPMASAAKSEADYWTTHRVEFDLMLRPASSVATSEESPSFHAVVPAVLDSTLLIPSGPANQAFQRWGDASTAAGETTIRLGALGKIATADAKLSSVSAPSGASAVTVLDVSPLRLKGQTRLVPGPSGWPALLPLTFPPNCIISAITGTGLIDWLDLPSEDDATQILLRLRTDMPAAPVSINFELPGQIVRGPDASIPGFPLWGGENIPHALGLIGPPAASFVLVNAAGMSVLAPDEWQALSDRPRPALAVSLKSPQPILLQWTRLSPVRTAVLSENLLVRRERIDWSASVRVSVSQVPTFRHQFRVDPGVRIDSVLAGENGVDGPVRFTRDGDLLSLFVPGGQLGERTFVFSGRIPLNVEAWSAIPTLELVNALKTENQLTVRDATFWNVEMETSAGARIHAPAQDTASTKGSGEASRTLAVYRKGTARPVRLRVLLPPQATRADSVALLQTPAQGDWEVITTFHLAATDTPLRKAVFHVPKELTGIRVRPVVFQHTTQGDEEGTTVTVRIPDRYYNSATITIAARLTPELRGRLMAERAADRDLPAIPVVSVLSAQQASQFVLISPESPLMLAATGSLRVSGATFPAWAPPEWSRALQRQTLACYQQIRPDLAVLRKTGSATAGLPVLHLEETIVWPMFDGTQSGLTRVWLSTKDASHLHLAHPREVSINLVLSDESTPLTWTSGSAGTQVQLPRREALTSLLVHWKRTAADGQIRLLDYGGQKPGRRLLAVAHANDLMLEAGTGPRMEPLDAWLARWEALLNCLEDVSASLPVDSLLLRNIRLCQKEVEARLTSQETLITPGQYAQKEKLAARWAARRNSLVISATSSPESATELPDQFTSLLEHQGAGFLVDWLAPETRSWSGQLKAQVLSPAQWKGIWGGMLVAAWVGLVFGFSAQLNRLREQLSHHPTLSFTILGMLWWLLLSPSVLGLLLVFFAWAASLLRQGIALVRAARRTGSEATASQG